MALIFCAILFWSWGIQYGALIFEVFSYCDVGESWMLANLLVLRNLGHRFVVTKRWMIVVIDNDKVKTNFHLMWQCLFRLKKLLDVIRQEQNMLRKTRVICLNWQILIMDLPWRRKFQIWSSKTRDGGRLCYVHVFFSSLKMMSWSCCFCYFL